jgi:WD40 repeat protein
LGLAATSSSLAHESQLRIALTGDAEPALSIAFSPNSSVLASGGAGTVTLWDAATGNKICALEGHTKAIVGLAYSPCGKTLASAGTDCCKLWDVTAGKNIATFDGGNTVAFSPDGKVLATDDGDQAVKLWNVKSGLAIATLDGHSDPVNSVAFSPDGKTLASGSDDGTVKLWDVTASKCVATLEGQSKPIFSVAFSPMGTTLASLSEDGTVRLWNVTTRLSTIIGSENEHNSVGGLAFSADGRTLVAAQKSNVGTRYRCFTPFEPDVEVDAVKLWDVATGRHNASLKGPSDAFLVALSQDGCTLAVGDYGSITLWNLRAGTNVEQ